MQEPPLVRSTRLPGSNSRTWLTYSRNVAAPMGPMPVAGPPRPSIVFARAAGVNVWDSDGNRFVDLAAGFGSLLLGHAHPGLQRTLGVQSELLMQAMGDLFTSEARVALQRRLAALLPGDDNQSILGLSGADAVSAALKTAVLHTGKPGVVAFRGGYHGLSYGPLAVCGLRPSYSDPFTDQLNPHVSWAPFPDTVAALEPALAALAGGTVGAVLIEPILGRGGVRPISADVLSALAKGTREAGALLIADEIWTGLGRAGHWLYSAQLGVAADLVCLGKGLGGGLPISALVGRREIMASWSREREVVHTSTFAGNPLACAMAISTLQILEDESLVARSHRVGAAFRQTLSDKLRHLDVSVRGEGLMVAVDLHSRPGGASAAMAALLQLGYITSTGGGEREVLVFTPPLNIAEPLLEQLSELLPSVLAGVLG